MINRVITVSFILLVFIFSFPKVGFGGEGASKKESTITVPSKDYPTIKKALEGADVGATIYVKAGVYNEGGDLRFKKGIKIYGAGADKTEITLDRLTLCSQSGGENSLSDIVIEGLTIKIGTGSVYIDFIKNLTIRKCIITGNGTGVYILRSDNVEIVNCTIANLKEGISLSYLPVKLTIRNSIISNCGRTGISISTRSKRSTIDYRTGKVKKEEAKEGGETIKLFLYYNDIWGHYNDFYDATADSTMRSKVPGEGNISKDPKFADMNKGDFHLQSGSPCIDVGDPDSEYNDPDGSRNDLGAIPYGVKKE